MSDIIKAAAAHPSTDHAHDCRCELCLDWWARYGTLDEPQNYGPFSKAEISNYSEALSITLSESGKGM